MKRSQLLALLFLGLSAAWALAEIKIVGRLNDGSWHSSTNSGLVVHTWATTTTTIPELLSNASFAGSGTPWTQTGGTLAPTFLNPKVKLPGDAGASCMIGQAVNAPIGSYTYLVVIDSISPGTRRGLGVTLTVWIGGNASQVLDAPVGTNSFTINVTSVPNPQNAVIAVTGRGDDLGAYAIISSASLKANP